MGHENYLTSTGHVSLFSAWEHLHKPGLLLPSTLFFFQMRPSSDYWIFYKIDTELKKTATWFVDDPVLSPLFFFLPCLPWDSGDARVVLLANHWAQLGADQTPQLGFGFTDTLWNHSLPTWFWVP